MESELVKIHNTLNFTDRRQLTAEIPEQLMVVKHIKPTDVVLEFGGSIGRNTCILSSILDKSENLVTIEPSPIERQGLQKNRQLNGFNFNIEPCVLSNKPLYSKGWYTFGEEQPNSLKVDNITWTELQNKYDLKFNAFVIDNEGNFVENLKVFPNILENVNVLTIEHDFNTEEDLQFFYSTMETNGLKMVDKYMKTDKFGPGMNWTDGLTSDPIFVSVWKK